MRMKKITGVVMAVVMAFAPVGNISWAGDVYSIAESDRPKTEYVTIDFAGDCALGKLQLYGYDGTVNAYYDNRGADYFMDGVKSVFESDDLTLVNLECVLTNETKRVVKTFNIKGSPKYTSILTKGSIEAVTLGNNHSADYGTKSLSDTKKALKKDGVKYAINDKVGMYKTESGIKIGFVSVSLLGKMKSSEDYIFNGIKKLKKKGADLILVLPHWGIERQYYPEAYQQKIAHKAIKNGADAVIGCHPHVLQSMEVYKGKMICYSLGNFCFGANKNPSDKDSMIYRQTFRFVNGKLDESKDAFDAVFYACSLSSHSGYNDYRPRLLKGSEKKRVINKMNKLSKPYSSLKIKKNGKIKY